MDPNGGDCVPAPTAVAPSALHSCGSLEAAYDKAQCGELVLVQSGGYGPQDIRDNARLDGCREPVDFQAAPGASVRLAAVEAGDLTQAVTDGGSNWRLQNASVGQGISLYPPAHDVTIDRIRGGTIAVNGARNVTVKESDLGPCYSGRPLVGNCTGNFKIQGWTSGGRTYAASNINIEHNRIHDFIDNADTHWECVFVDWGVNITFDANRFYDCQIYGIFIQPFSGYPISRLVIENNWFYATQNPGSDEHPLGSPRISAVDFGGNGKTISNVLIRYNSFAPDEGVDNDGGPTLGTNDWVIGNVGGNRWYRACDQPGVSFAYNVWNGTACSSTDTAAAKLPYVSAVAGAEDFHLRPGSVARGLISGSGPNFALARDFYDNPRSTTGPRDAGAVESDPVPRGMVFRLRSARAKTVSISGHLRLPLGVPSTYGCRGKVSAALAAHRRVASLNQRCGFALVMPAGPVGSEIVVRFAGNGYVAPLVISRRT